MIDIVQGEDIRHWYNERNHFSTLTDGGLFHSSMKFEHMQPYFGLYCENPNISLLVKTETDYDGVARLLGRALVWRDVNNQHYMDNIYADEETMWEMLLFSLNNDIKFLPLVRRKIVVPLEQVNFDTYPYVDTMSYMQTTEQDGWHLTNIPNFNAEPVYELSSHKGNVFRVKRPPVVRQLSVEELP